MQDVLASQGQQGINRHGGRGGETQDLDTNSHVAPLSGRRSVVRAGAELAPPLTKFGTPAPGLVALRLRMHFPTSVSLI